jgi:predicted N-acetyltransferase YhbS
VIVIEEERPDDHWEIEALLDNAFAPGRTSLSSYRLREGVDPVAALCLTARDDDEIAALAGTIRFWPVEIGEARSPSLLLGPVAAHPTRQGEGIGAMLILEGLERAEKAGWERCLLIGDEPYYARFGFRRAFATAIAFPPPTNPNRILAKPLTEGGMNKISGEVRRAQT